MRRKTISFYFSVLLLLSQGAAADTTCNLNALRVSFHQLITPVAPDVWIEATRTDDGRSSAGPQIVQTGGTVFTASFVRHLPPAAMLVPADFTFRSGWKLNTQFAFIKGDALSIKERYELANGEKYYAVVASGSPNLRIFARPDGTLCNKVMNNSRGDHVFLAKEYRSMPETRLVSDAPASDADPVMLKIVYLGSSGGLTTFREIWSRQGRILSSSERRFDSDWPDVRIAGETLHITSATATVLTVLAAPLVSPIKLDRGWDEMFAR